MNRNFKLTVYASYIGYITQAVVNNLAPLLFVIFRERFGISLAQITLLTTVNFLVQLSVDLLSAKFLDKLGYRVSIVMAHCFAAAGLVCMAVLPFALPNAFVGLLLSAVLYAVGGGIIEVLISPIVEACPTENKASAMSLLHSFYCWGTVGVVALSTLFLHFAGRDSWRLLAVLWAVLPLGNALLFCRVPINTLTQAGDGATPKALFKNKTFWLFAVLMVTAGASEQGMSQWASAFAESGLGVTKTVGDLAGACMFSVLMGTARVVSAKLTQKVSLTAMMTASGVLCVLSYLLAALSPQPVLSLIGCALCGLSVGVLWPGTFSLASAAFPKGGTALFALLALAGDLGCVSGPTLVGEIAGAAGDNLKLGLLCAVMFPAVLIVLCRRIRKG